MLVGQVARLARRRLAEAEEAAESSGVLASAEHALGAATQATQDSLTVAIEGYTAASEGRDDPVQHAQRVHRRLRR